MLNLGEMRFHVRIERPSAEQGPSGQPVDEWLLFAARRAARKAGAIGSEAMAPQQRFARAPVLWKLRWLAGVEGHTEMRLVSDGKVYEIISAVDPDGLKAELHINSLERVGEMP
jgi:head-tail adaptor